MQNLLQFLFRNGVVLLFLLLEFMCFYMVVRTNERQGAIYHKSADLLTGALNKQAAAMVDYWKLGSVNDSLQVENAKLRAQLSSSMMTPQTSGIFPDTTYRVISARVIKNSIQARNNFITLNQGSLAGSNPGMGVISAQGPVGVVVSTTRHYSKVMSILNSHTMISASVRSKGYFGSLVWRGFNPTRMKLEAIPKHAFLEKGDTVITSGYSQIFPPGLQIGLVDSFWLERGSNFYTIDVKLDVDMSNIQSVYLFENLLAHEVDSLTAADSNE